MKFSIVYIAASVAAVGSVFAQDYGSVAGTESPAVSTPVAGMYGQTEQGMVSPAEQGMVSPTEQGMASPTEQGMASPTEQGMASPIDQGMASPTEQGMASPTEQGMASPTEQGMASPTEQGMASPTEQGMASPTEQGMASPIDQGMASPIDQGMASPTEQGLVPPTEQATATVAETVATPETEQPGMINFGGSYMSIGRGMPRMIQPLVNRIVSFFDYSHLSTTPTETPAMLQMIYDPVIGKFTHMTMDTMRSDNGYYYVPVCSLGSIVSGGSYSPQDCPYSIQLNSVPINVVQTILRVVHSWFNVFRTLAMPRLWFGESYSMRGNQ
ncbi:hypothetical protein IWW48_003409 [Coemansia sp. RSA 1200]|nr:hypothetical protein IWW48_003409 [Coemansia sp. RSA 1200]